MSINVHPSNWRLRTTGGIRYKLLEGFPKGTFEAENGKITEQYVIQSSDLIPFVLESFAPMVEW
ncbi:hypothetical protein KAH94_02950, partial [bacterium]|nr:hypothetical protein [bacterium]